MSPPSTGHRPQRDTRPHPASDTGRVGHGQLLDVQQVALRLGRSPARIRQRLTDHTLLGQRSGAGWQIPAFQFADDGELPGWDQVALTLPREIPFDAVERFLNQPHAALIIDGTPATPRQWLARGLDPAAVTQAIVHARRTL